MPDPNPYAPPAVEPLPESRELFRRVAEYLVVRDGAVLPARCIKTNRPLGKGDWVRNRRIGYQRPWIQMLYLVPLGFIGLNEAFPSRILPSNHLLLLAPVAGLVPLLFLKRGRVTYGCTLRTDAWRWGAFGISVGTSAVIGWFIFSGAISPYWLVLCAVITCLIAALCAKKSSFRVVHYRDGEFWLKGCCPVFLDSLPSS